MRRLVIGMEADCGESAALCIADEQATGRIFAAADYDADEKARRRIMRNALLRLKRNDRNFAMAVLGGATHRELGISRQAFAKRMSKILKAVLTKTKKTEKSCRAPINIG